MPRLALTDEQLIDYSAKHLLYEIQMFRWLAATVPPMPVGHEKSAFLESFAVHLRNLIDFFFPQNARPTDVIAADFYDDPAKWNLAISTTTLELARTRANKEVSHLTLDRKYGKDQDPWPIVDWYREIRTTAKAFTAGASVDKLSPEVVDWINKYLGTLDAVLAVVAMGPMSNTTSVSTSSVVAVGGAGGSKKSTD
jgi:hypothetical protein